MIRSLLIALALIVAPAAALAVPVEGEPHGEGGAQGHEAAGHGHADPSKTFNWFGHWMPFGSDSYKNLDQHGGTLESGETPMSVPFILVLINFGIVLFLIGWKVAPMASQMAAKRSDEIKTALDEAARLRTAAKDKLAEYDQKLRAAETEIEQLIKDMRADAEADKQRIIAAAEAQAAALKKDAEERIAAEIDRARHVLQREVAAAAGDVAERLLRDKTTPADQAKLVDLFVQGVGTGAPS